jgi:hypothetical protein
MYVWFIRVTVARYFQIFGGPMARIISIFITLFLFPILVSTQGALAQADSADIRFGGDYYAAGNTAALSGATATDVFLAGESVRVAAPATGAAHLAGRRVEVSEDISGNLYAAGQDIALQSSIGGSATTFGQRIDITGAIAGNLRAFGQNMTLNAPISGAAILTGETITLNSSIAGDVMLTGHTVTFGTGATIAGSLAIYHSDPDSITVPATVMDGANITRHVVEETSGWADQGMTMVRPTFWSKTAGLITSILCVTIAAILLAAIFPTFVAGARAATLAAPFRTLWMGFLGLSAVAGSLILLAMTGIGLLLVPVSIFLVVLLAFVGYVMAAYVLGVALLSLIGRGMPTSSGDRSLAALAGGVGASLLVLVPFIGWWVTLALVWGGAGALIVRLVGPGFFTNTSKA